MAHQHLELLWQPLGRAGVPRCAAPASRRAPTARRRPCRPSQGLRRSCIRLRAGPRRWRRDRVDAVRPPDMMIPFGLSPRAPRHPDRTTLAGCSSRTRAHDQLRKLRTAINDDHILQLCAPPPLSPGRAARPPDGRPHPKPGNIITASAPPGEARSKQQPADESTVACCRFTSRYNTKNIFRRRRSAAP